MKNNSFNILVVDDILENITIVGHILHLEDINISIAQSGIEALSIINFNKPDLVLLDISMPGLSGLEVCDIMKSSKTTSDIPIIFISALADTNDIIKGLRAGAVDYITKPFRAEELIARVKIHLELKNAKDLINEQNSKLTENVSLLNSLFASVGDMIFHKDSECKYLGCNKSYENMTGLAVDELTGKTDDEVFSPEIAQISRDTDEQVLTGRKKTLSESWIEFSNGKKVYISIVKSPIIGPDGSVYGIVGVAHDLTDRKAIEDEMKELNAMKDKFFSIIAHDLRNPFNSLIGLSQVLSSSIGTMKVEKSAELAKMINKSAISGHKLLENLLQWSLSQSGGLKFSPVELDLNECLGNMVFAAEMEAKKKQINVESNLHGEPRIVADRNMLETIIRNLLSNAIKFTHPEGKIILRSQCLKDSINITIEDNGIGIEPEKLDQLFSHRGLVQSVGTDGENGTGLGLILCKEFAIKHNGIITVESEPEKGSNFTLTIPKNYCLLEESCNKQFRT